MTFFLRVKTFYHETNNSKTNKFACIGTFVYIVYICKKHLDIYFYFFPQKNLDSFVQLCLKYNNTLPCLIKSSLVITL